MSNLLEGRNFRPEENLLLSSISPHHGPEQVKAVRSLIRQGIDWSYLLQIAAHHGVLPLLYKSLNTTCRDTIPEQILDELRRLFRDNAVRNLFLTETLIKLLKQLAAHEIPAIPFKGPVLASSLHGDISLRQFGDLDILVRKQDVPAARRFLVSQGYYPELDLNDRQERTHIKSHYALSFSSEDRSILIDLHWGITAPNLFRVPDLGSRWECLDLESILGRKVRTFSREDLLLVLCVHGTKHGWAFLSWICDIAFITEGHNGIDWDRVFNQARSHGSERMLLLGLFLANELLGTALPKEASERLCARDDIAGFANQVYRILFRYFDVSASSFDGCMFFLRAMDRFKDRLRHCCLKLVPTPSEWTLLPLPAYLSPIYYVIRPIRLLGKYLPHLVRYIAVRGTLGKQASPLD